MSDNKKQGNTPTQTPTKPQPITEHKRGTFDSISNDTTVSQKVPITTATKPPPDKK